MMPLIFGFLNLSLVDVVDVLLVALLIYLAFRWIKNSSGLNIFIAVIAIYVIKVLVDAFNMKMMGALLGIFIDVGVIALIVIFQPEIRHFLSRVGSARVAGGRSSILDRLLGKSGKVLDGNAANEIAEACRRMSENKTGALIVLLRRNSLEHIVRTGDIVDAAISRRLIMNLFFKNSPLHDGAVLINNDRIVAARCTLPITQREDIPAHYGMRHKAAIGISEESDADVIVVSEETGQVSFVRGGKVREISNINELKLLLAPAVKNAENDGKRQDN